MITLLLAEWEEEEYYLGFTLGQPYNWGPM